MENVLLWLFSASALGSVCSLPVRQYHFIYDPKNWTEAQSHCRQRYTDLVTVDSLNMVTKLNGLADVSRMGSTADAWIGLYFDVVSWRWSLSDGGFYPADGSYRLWSPGEPNSAWYTADCAHMYDNGYWNDAPCQWLYGFICANTSGQTAAFFYINTLMNWTDAQSYCRLHYTDLASVRSLQENEQIRAARPAGLIVWIGLYKDTWKWSNGNLFLFSYWASGQPDGGLNNCTAADYSLSGRWEDWPCGLEKAFICYHDAEPFTRHTVKVKLVGNSALDLNDPAVLENLLKELQQKLQDQAVKTEIRLSWKNQPDGKIFYRGKQN
ncbi:macrophage mannose receptor 1-like [Gambusia affinis]|uniref:macrophage mannose receptor 1-like n=1 Tax=Gambusia affinis TaxID=33528 RepID=UPI001CDC4DE7|nr:macrophage mannose receptor 1-like [Gambusia affinis]